MYYPAQIIQNIPGLTCCVVKILVLVVLWKMCDQLQNNIEAELQPARGRGRGRGRGSGKARGSGSGSGRGQFQNNLDEEPQPSSSVCIMTARGRGRERGCVRGRERGRGQSRNNLDEEPQPSSSECITTARGRGRERGCARGRERGRGRGHEIAEEPQPTGNSYEGRGGRIGQSIQGPVELVELVQVRAEKALTKRRLNVLSVEEQREFLDRKRKAELVLVRLPDAPPRKRRARLSSPEREACVLIDQPGPAPRPMPEPAPRPMSEPAEIFDIAAMDCIFVGPEVEIETQPSSSQAKTKTHANVNDTNFEIILDDWVLANDSDVDMDDDIDDACPLPAIRNASIEPACLTDLTELQTCVLQTEDELNDQVLRDIVTNIDNYHFEWKGEKENFTGHRENFTGTSGPTFDVTNKTVVEIFYKMIDTDFIDRICIETNRYAEQKIALLKAENKLLPTSRLTRWTPTDRDEMYTFLAVLILQGLYPLPEEEKYFSYNGFGTMPYFSRVISYNRFMLLKSMYHFVNNETLTEKTKLCKIQPVLDYFNEKFSSLYKPSQEIVIGESLLKRHGRLSFAQKIATKAAQVGVKTYELCESRSGYLWKYFVYVGKKTWTRMTGLGDETIDQPDVTVDRPDDARVDRLDDNIGRPNDETLDRPDNEMIDQPSNETQEDTIDLPDGSFACPTNATAKIVFDLVEPLLNLGHTLIMDNFYNSPLLLRFLKTQKTDCYGTLRLNREFVPDSLKKLNKADLRQGEVVASYSSDLSVMVWRDANLVSMISTYHHLQIGTQNKYDRLTYKPKIVLDYNKSMGGVDRKDQFLSAHPVERLRNKIWYKKVFCRLFSTAVFNSFIIFSTKNRKMTHREFRTILAEDLLKIHRRIDLTTEPRLYTNMNRQLTIRKNTQPTVDHDHFPARSNIKKARCWMCTRRQRDTRTIWKCIQCNVNLCIEHCFRDYHKKKALNALPKLTYTKKR